jgi:hypothetical protein
VFKFHTLKTNTNLLLHHLETPSTRLIQTNCCTILRKVHNPQFKLKLQSNYKGKSVFETSNDFLNTYSFCYSPRKSDIVIWSYVGKSYPLHIIYWYWSHFLSTKSEDSHNVGELSNRDREICVIFLFWWPSNHLWRSFL